MTERDMACREVLREDRILAELDPDRLGTEPPPWMPADEPAEFVELCDRLDAAQ